MGTRSFPVAKWPWHGIDHPPPSSAAVKERVELHLYSTYGPLWPIRGWISPFFLPLLISKANTSTGSQKLLSILYNLKGHYHAWKSLQPASNLNQINPVHAITYYRSGISILSLHHCLGLPNDLIHFSTPSCTPQALPTSYSLIW